MSIKTYFQQTCPLCRKALRLDVDLLGKSVPCDYCGAELVARDGEPAAPPGVGMQAWPLLLVNSQCERLDQLAQWFGRSGMHVIKAHHPRMALEAADSRLRSFRVAIVDYALPEIDGLELTQKLMRRVQDLRVILLADPEHGVPEEAAYAAGAWQFLPCKAPLEQLESLVEEAYCSCQSVDAVSQALLQRMS